MTALANHPSRAFVPYPPAALLHAPDGPLAGLTFAVKDLFEVAGYPTGCGQPLLLAQSGISARTAPTVARLLAAGARFVGKTHTDELAFSMNGKNAHFGTPINGAAPDRIPGGSSSGSASAVSNQLCDFALGTDTGGSIRAPASHCGLFGLRPTHGRVSLDGVWPLAASFDTCGWFARDVATLARVADVLLDREGMELSAAPRLLLPTDLWSLIDPTVTQALQPAVDRLCMGLAAGSPTEVCVFSKAQGFTPDALYWAFRYIQGYEAWQADGPFITTYAPPLGPGVAERFAWARTVTGQQNDDSWRLRRAYTAWLSRVIGDDGVLVLPTMPDIAPLLTEPEEALQDYRERALRLLMISGLTGFAQLTLPYARRLDAPLGISLLGPPGSDRALIALAERIG